MVRDLLQYTQEQDSLVMFPLPSLDYIPERPNCCYSNDFQLVRSSLLSSIELVLIVVDTEYGGAAAAAAAAVGVGDDFDVDNFENKVGVIVAFAEKNEFQKNVLL